MRLKKSSFWSKIPNWVWLLISLAVAIILWLLAAYSWPAVFATPKAVIDAFISKAASGVLWGHFWASLSRVLAGFAIAFVVSIPVAFLMAWYDPFRHVVEPWIQFIRNIPPLAYVFLIVAALGIGQVAKVTVIFIAAFLVMVITIRASRVWIPPSSRRPGCWVPNRATFSSKSPFPLLPPLFW